MKRARQCLIASTLVLGDGCDAHRTSSLAEMEGDTEGPGQDPIDPDDPGSDEDKGADDLGPTPVDVHGQLRVDGARLVDENGDVVQLRGVSSMWLNWEEDGYAENLTALRWMRNNWGLKVIRASMGIEPDGAYLQDPATARAQVERIVDNAIEAGVYVIIDWHDHNAHEHQAEAVQFFTDMAMAYGDQPNVLYEPYNEPLSVSWLEVVKPYHEAVIAAVRSADPDNVVILGTPNWSQDVNRAIDDPVEGDNIMYTLHFYSCTHGSSIRSKGDRALQEGLALFITEWGATDADGGTDGLLCLDEAAVWHDWIDANDVSWTAWKLDDCSQDSSCILAPEAPLTGGWTSDHLNGHALFVRARMQQGQ